MYPVRSTSHNRERDGSSGVRKLTPVTCPARQYYPYYAHTWPLDQWPLRTLHDLLRGRSWVSRSATLATFGGGMACGRGSLPNTGHTPWSPRPTRSSDSLRSIEFIVCQPTICLSGAYQPYSCLLLRILLDLSTRKVTPKCGSSHSHQDFVHGSHLCFDSGFSSGPQSASADLGPLGTHYPNQLKPLQGQVGIRCW